MANLPGCAQRAGGCRAGQHDREQAAIVLDLGDTERGPISRPTGVGYWHEVGRPEAGCRHPEIASRAG